MAGHGHFHLIQCFTLGFFYPEEYKNKTQRTYGCVNIECIFFHPFKQDRKSKHQYKISQP